MHNIAVFESLFEGESFGLDDPYFDGIFHHCHKVIVAEFPNNTDTCYCGLCVRRTRSKAYSKARAEQYCEEGGNLFDEKYSGLDKPAPPFLQESKKIAVGHYKYFTFSTCWMESRYLYSGVVLGRYRYWEEISTSEALTSNGCSDVILTFGGCLRTASR